jgi:ribonuclease PH
VAVRRVHGRNDAGHVGTAISGAAIALNDHGEYERAMNVACSCGCF